MLTRLVLLTGVLLLLLPRLAGLLVRLTLTRVLLLLLPGQLLAGLLLIGILLLLLARLLLIRVLLLLLRHSLHSFSCYGNPMCLAMA